MDIEECYRKSLIKFSEQKSGAPPKQEIPGPEKLRRFGSRMLDPTCFLNVYLRERSDFDGQTMQKYWDKVAALDK